MKDKKGFTKHKDGTVSCPQCGDPKHECLAATPETQHKRRLPKYYLDGETVRYIDSKSIDWQIAAPELKGHAAIIIRAVNVLPILRKHLQGKCDHETTEECNAEMLLLVYEAEGKS